MEPLDELEKQKKELEIEKLKREVALLNRPFLKLLREQPSVLFPLLGSIIAVFYLITTLNKQRDQELQTLISDKEKIQQEKNQLREQTTNYSSQINELKTEVVKYNSEKALQEKEHAELALKMAKDSLLVIGQDLIALIQRKYSLEVALQKADFMTDSVASALKFVKQGILLKEKRYRSYQADLVIKSGNFDYYSAEVDSLILMLGKESYSENAEDTTSVYGKFLRAFFDSSNNYGQLISAELLYKATRDSFYWLAYRDIATKLAAERGVKACNPFCLINYFFNYKWTAEEKACLLNAFALRIEDSSLYLSNKIDLIGQVTDKMWNGEIPYNELSFIQAVTKASNSYFTNTYNSYLKTAYDASIYSHDVGSLSLKSCPQAFLMNELKYNSGCPGCEIFDTFDFTLPLSIHYDSSGKISFNMSKTTVNLMLLKDFQSFRASTYVFPTPRTQESVYKIKKLEASLNYPSLEIGDTVNYYKKIRQFYKELDDVKRKYTYLIDRWTDPDLTYFNSHKDEFIYCIKYNVFERQ